MGRPDKTGKDLAQFNVKNAVYALEGSTQTVKPMTWMNTFSKDRSVTAKKLYGDGEIVCSIFSDKSSSGTLGTTSRDDIFEEDLGLIIKPDGGGTAEIAGKPGAICHIGFETDFVGKDGIKKTKKTWVYSVQVSPPNDSYTQDQDDITTSASDYPYEAYGINLKASTGETDYVDENGQTVRVYTWSKKPGDEGYETFLESVQFPKKAAQ